MKTNEQLIEEGWKDKFNSSGQITNFIFLLMRDYLPIGKVEELVKSLEEYQNDPQNVNILLNDYSKQLADRVVNAEVNKLSKSLGFLFEGKKTGPVELYQNRNGSITVSNKVILDGIDTSDLSAVSDVLNSPEYVSESEETIDVSLADSKAEIERSLAAGEIDQDEANRLLSDWEEFSESVKLSKYGTHLLVDLGEAEPKRIMSEVAEQEDIKYVKKELPPKDYELGKFISGDLTKLNELVNNPDYVGPEILDDIEAAEKLIEEHLMASSYVAFIDEENKSKV